MPRRAAARPRLGPPVQRVHSSAGTGIPWGKLVLGAAIAYGAWAGWHKVGGADGISRLGSSPSVEQMSQLAASRQASDVLMYSAAWCPNCTAAQGWMGQYGFKYEECDIDKDSACMAQLRALDPQGGVPYLIVRGQHMKDGFDSEQFLVALAK
jgi:glutaredoxin